MKKIKLKNDASSLYIHIPFCSQICSYCDFTKIIYDCRIAFLYILEVIKEINELRRQKNKFKTIYIGGGTPSALEPFLLDDLLFYCSLLINKDADYEFTVEMNVEDITESKLKILKENKVNRISIGIQTFDNNILKKLNRNYTKEIAIEKVNLAKKFFNNINLDLIYAMPFSNIEILRKDLEELLKLNVKHISTYSLQICSGTTFYNENIKELDQDETRKQYDLILNTLRANGYKRYEVSNFARDKCFSKHNLCYWKDDKYYSIGVGASGYIGNIRYTNTKNILEYIGQEKIKSYEMITKKDDIEYFLLTNLRLEDGFKFIDFNKRFNSDFLKRYKVKISHLILEKLIIIDQNSIRCSDDGIMLLDKVLEELI